MTIYMRFFAFVLAASWTLHCAAAAPSVNGANIFAEPSILDSQNSAWTIVSGVVQKNGVTVGINYNVNLLIELNSVFYQRNTSNSWYMWNGIGPYWPNVADPRVVSANGGSIGMGTGVLIDSGKHIWTLPSTGYGYTDGYVAGSNYNTILLVYYNSEIYSENTSHHWYSWNGSVWTQVAGDPRGAKLVQYNVHTSPACPASDPSCTPQFEGNSSVTLKQSTVKGNTIWVAATVSDYGGTHSMAVTDSQNNTYHALDQLNDGSPGSQSLAQFYASDIEGGNDTITVNWSSDNYKGVVAAELAGVSGTPLVGHNAHTQDGNLVSGSANVTSNGISITSGHMPSLLISLTMDTDGGGSDVGGTGYCAIPSTSGFQQIAQFWSWATVGQPSCNLATLETSTVGETGNVSGSFTSSHLSDPYVTVATAFH
jgi:hypothetical protein